MNAQNLIIYKFDTLYHILKEVEEHLNFNIIAVSTEKNLNFEINKSSDYLIFTQNNKSQYENQVILEKFPIEINKLIEKLNIEFLKKKIY